MSMVEFPQRNAATLQDLAARLIESRKPGSDLKAFARHALLGFYDLCQQTGLDRVIAELADAWPPVGSIDIDDRTGLADHEAVLAALVAQLVAIDLDGGGPRAAKPRQVAESLITALGLMLVEQPDRAISLAGALRAEVAAAMATVANIELAVPAIRDAVVADARRRCDERFIGAFDKIAAQLDERGMQLLKQPKVPIDAVQGVQQVLAEARHALIDRVGRAAIDRAAAVLARVDPEVATRIDQPVSRKLTPRDVAILRASSARVSKTPDQVVASLLDSLSEMIPIAWQVVERAARPYAASQTFAVGELIDHAKFGRGTVVSCLLQRIDVEFADGKHTLIHVPVPRPR